MKKYKDTSEMLCHSWDKEENNPLTTEQQAEIWSSFFPILNITECQQLAKITCYDEDKIKRLSIICENACIICNCNITFITIQATLQSLMSNK